MKKSSIVMLTVAAMMMLSGCAALTPAGSSPSSTRTPVAGPSETPAEPGVTKIVIGSPGLVLEDSTGAQVSAFSWFDDSAVIIAGLTTAFGAAPTEVPYEGAIESRPGVDYTWGGFALRVQDFTATPPLDSNLSALTTTARVGRVAIEASGGVTVGSTRDAVAAVAVSSSQGPAADLYYYTDSVVVTSASDDSGPYDLHNFTLMICDDQLVTKIQAPIKDYGA